MHRIILIVEDEVDAAEVLETIFSLWGFQTLTAHNGAEGYALATEFLPDLILSDWMMPKVDGIQMAALLAANPATSKIPVVLMSAVYDALLSARHVASTLQKPFQIDELRAVLDALMADLPVRTRTPSVFVKDSEQSDK